MATRNFKTAIARNISRLTGHTEPFLLGCIERPKLRSHGEFSIPIPKLIKTPLATGERIVKKPVDLSKELAEKFPQDPLIRTATPQGAFLNFSVHPVEFIRQVVTQVHTECDGYGMHPSLGRGRTCVVDYSSPNIAKPFHAGHLRSTILGNFVSKVHEACGWKVIGINYLGDWGKQYGLLAVGFDKYGDQAKLEQDPIHHLYEVYIRINKEAETDKEIDVKAKEYFKRMEEGDPYTQHPILHPGDETALSTWRHFRTLSIASYTPLYTRLNIRFDVYTGESETDAHIPRIQDLLAHHNLAITDPADGAVHVDLDRWDLGKPVIRRADGTSLYVTRDLASLAMRRERWAFDRAVYVVGHEQERYLKQVFRIAGLLWGGEREEEEREIKRRRIEEKTHVGEEEMEPDNHWTEDLVHVSFGRIHGMSTRKGNVVFLRDILDTARATMLEIMRGNEEKFEEIMEVGTDANTGEGKEGASAQGETTARLTGEAAVEQIADVVGASAVVVQDMQGRRAKDYDFSWERMTDAIGDTGVYLQYAHARIC
ncbi:arginyl-tRNA synthetase, partial [Jimgerdemannia flammicorona]